MSFATLERAVLAELKQVAKNNKLRLKDIMEWSTGEVKAQEGETLYFLPDLKVWCAVKVAQQKVQRIVGKSAASDSESTPTPQPLT
jgi:hypothetical protein